jgi:hypothetical protein
MKDNPTDETVFSSNTASLYCLLSGGVGCEVRLANLSRRLRA